MLCPHTLFKLKHFIFILKHSFKITKKHPLWPYRALYMQFSRHALFIKATPISYRINHDFNCHINERETPKTCLTNHKGSILHHIMPLVINSLGDGHTHTQAYRHCGQKQFQETSRTLAEASTRLV